jgi:beta-N-acetylglucosaminidase
MQRQLHIIMKKLTDIENKLSEKENSEKQKEPQEKKQINQKHKEYREKNKERIKEYMKQKVKCDLCGSTVLKRQLKRHQNTMKCKKHHLILFSDED